MRKELWHHLELSSTAFERSREELVGHLKDAMQCVKDLGQTEMELSNAINGLINKINNLEADNSALYLEIASLKSKVVNLEGNLSEVNKKLSDSQSKIAHLEVNLAQFEKKLSDSESKTEFENEANEQEAVIGQFAQTVCDKLTDFFGPRPERQFSSPSYTQLNDVASNKPNAPLTREQFPAVDRLLSLINPTQPPVAVEAPTDPYDTFHAASKLISSFNNSVHLKTARDLNKWLQESACAAQFADKFHQFIEREEKEPPDPVRPDLDPITRRDIMLLYKLWKSL